MSVSGERSVDCGWRVASSAAASRALGSPLGQRCCSWLRTTREEPAQGTTAPGESPAPRLRRPRAARTEGRTHLDRQGTEVRFKQIFRRSYCGKPWSKCWTSAHAFRSLPFTSIVARSHRSSAQSILLNTLLCPSLPNGCVCSYVCVFPLSVCFRCFRFAGARIDLRLRMALLPPFSVTR